MRRLHILQVNMGRRRVVADELGTLARSADNLAIQEPRCQKNVVTGFGTTSRVVSLGSGERRPRAEIVVVNPGLDVMELKQFTTADQAACYIRWSRVAFALVSAYMPPRQANVNINVEDNIAAVEAVALKYKSVIVCSDINSWNTAWGSVRTDARGRLVAECVSRCQLVIMNKPSGPTFVGARGQSWINVTLATAPIAKRIAGIADWTLRSDTSSDHQVIACSVVEEEGGAPEVEMGFVTRSANWRAFSSELDGILADKE